MAKKIQTIVSPQEKYGLQEIFEVFDQDGNGCISFNQFKLAIRATGQNPTLSDLEQMIQLKLSNPDGNNEVTFDEFVNMTQMIKNKPRTDLKKAFNMFDKNKDGFISRDELTEILTSMGEKMDKSEVDGFFDEYDLNKDEKIDLEEFIRVLDTIDNFPM